jgi:hypothetical protein
VTLLVAFAIALLYLPLPEPPTGLTPATSDEIRDALDHSHRMVFGRSPSPTRLRMAIAQVDVETGRGRKMRGHNPANLGAGEGDHVRYYRIGGSRFRAFRNLLSGCLAYWILLRDRCSAALAAMNWGDVDMVAEHLHRCGFYRAPVERYADEMRGVLR